MQNVKQIWEETTKVLEKVYERREAENISYLLLEDSFSVTRADIIAEKKSEIDRIKLKGLTTRLLKNEPIQYVTGVADFFGRKFKLASGALIPRPETEELCELIINENKIAGLKVLDIGTGSGCIAITLSLELNASVEGIDVSWEALSIAQANSNTLNGGVLFKSCNILVEELSHYDLDILVSNPPYIPFKDQSKMRSNVLDYEPEIALFVSDDNPIIFYKTIAKEGIRSLKPGGKLYFEIHENYGEEIEAHLKEIGYQDIKIHQDMQGKDRMISAINSANR
ncbi:peptide chain release factor N(5)-glutamine methyltransferase [Ekhidna sp.]